MTTSIPDELPEGRRLKDVALALVEARRKVYLLRGRRALLVALLDRGEATADDVRAAVELPPDVDPKCLGAVPGLLAAGGIIRRDRFTSTTRATAHARPVSVWTLTSRQAAEQWLADHPDRPEPTPARQQTLFAPMENDPGASAVTDAPGNLD